MPTMKTGRMCQPDTLELEAARQQLGISKAELCCRLGVRPATYNGYLRGDEMPVSIRDGVRSMCHISAQGVAGVPLRERERGAEA